MLAADAMRDDCRGVAYSVSLSLHFTVHYRVAGSFACRCSLFDFSLIAAHFLLGLLFALHLRGSLAQPRMDIGLKTGPASGSSETSGRASGSSAFASSMAAALESNGAPLLHKANAGPCVFVYCIWPISAVRVLIYFSIKR